MIYTSNALFDYPKVEKPDYYTGAVSYFGREMEAYRQWLSSRTKIDGPHPWKEGDVLEEGEDYKIEEHIRFEETGSNQFDARYKDVPFKIAIPIVKGSTENVEAESRCNPHDHNLHIVHTGVCMDCGGTNIVDAFTTHKAKGNNVAPLRWKEFERKYKERFFKDLRFNASAVLVWLKNNIEWLDESPSNVAPLRWVKASERLPEFESFDKAYVVKYTMLPKERYCFSLDMIKAKVEADYEIEWLDESVDEYYVPCSADKVPDDYKDGDYIKDVVTGTWLKKSPSNVASPDEYYVITH